ncbi:MAG: hypothetical protein QM767_02975 [Anaeromyxobacter sp.]
MPFWSVVLIRRPAASYAYFTPYCAQMSSTCAGVRPEVSSAAPTAVSSATRRP